MSNCGVFPQHVGVSGRRLHQNRHDVWQYDGAMTSYWSYYEGQRWVEHCDGARGGAAASVWLIVMVGLQ